MCDSALRPYNECASRLKKGPRQAKRSLGFLNLAESALNKIADSAEAENPMRIGIALQKRTLGLRAECRLVQLLNLGEFEFARIYTLPLDDDSGSLPDTIGFIKQRRPSQVVMENSIAFLELLYGIVTTTMFTSRSTIVLYRLESKCAHSWDPSRRLPQSRRRSARS
jgi:hypothetical protein